MPNTWFYAGYSGSLDVRDTQVAPSITGKALTTAARKNQPANAWNYDEVQGAGTGKVVFNGDVYIHWIIVYDWNGVPRGFQIRLQPLPEPASTLWNALIQQEIGDYVFFDFTECPMLLNTGVANALHAAGSGSDAHYIFGWSK